MRFLLFNLAVVAALFYLFSAGRSGSDIGNDHREDPLQAIRQELESLARDIADGRDGADRTPPGTAIAETPTGDAQAPWARVVEPAPGGSKERSGPAAAASGEAASSTAEAVPATAQALEGDRQEGGAAADPIGPLPQVEDPLVAQRRAEVLDGVGPLGDGDGETQVKGGPPMSSEERLRRLYSLAEEMELLYVSKMTR